MTQVYVYQLEDQVPSLSQLPRQSLMGYCDRLLKQLTDGSEFRQQSFHNKHFYYGDPEHLQFQVLCDERATLR